MKRYDLLEQGDTALTETEDGAYYLATEVDAKVKEYDDDNLALSQSVSNLGARISELETALRPFALAHGYAAAYVRTFELAKPMDRRDLFMWQSNRSLCVDDYATAAKAYGGQTTFGL